MVLKLDVDVVNGGGERSSVGYPGSVPLLAYYVWFYGPLPPNFIELKLI